MSQGTFTTKKEKTLHDEIASSLEAVQANTLRKDYEVVARTALQKVQQEVATNIWRLAKSELENKELREKLDTLEKKERTDDKEETNSVGLKFNVISR